MPVIQEPVTVSIDKILVATDFSDVSRKAGAYAAAIARHFGSKLEIVHVFDPSVVTSYEEAIITMPAIDRKRIADENLAAFVAQLPLTGDEGAVPSTALSVEGHRPATAIIDIAAGDQVDLIVVGTESKSGLARLLLRSTAERILRSAACPVLTVGPRARMPEPGPLVFRNIVYATDFSAEAVRAATFALSFAEDSNARLYCCCVLTLNDEGLQSRAELHEAFSHRLKEMLPESAYDWCSPECIVEHGEAATSILSLAAKVEADLIVLGARRPSFWLTHVEGGLTPALLAEARCPVLTIS